MPEQQISSFQKGQKRSRHTAVQKTKKATNSEKTILEKKSSRNQHISQGASATSPVRRNSRGTSSQSKRTGKNVRNRPRKSYIKKTQYSISQNFLTSSVTIRQLMKLAKISASDHVIEIGAGKGHITRELAKICRQVSAYEADQKLVEILKEQLPQKDNIKITARDFLQVSLPEKGDYKVFSNIPFAITSDIIRKLTETKNPPKDTWIVMEKGAAIRFVGKKFDTAASLALKPFFSSRVVHQFQKSDFHPEPSVDVVFLHIRKKETPDIPVSQRKRFLQFVDISQKYGLLKLLNRKQVSGALRDAGLPPLEECSELSYTHWIHLFRASLSGKR